MVVGKRIKWKNYLYLICSLCFIGVDIWLFYSLFSSKKTVVLLLVMTFVSLFIALLLLILSIIGFLKKTNAVIIDNNKVILKGIKDKTIYFKDIKDITYISNRTNNRIASIKYNSGTLVFTKVDNKTIKISDIKNVKDVVISLRNNILNPAKK